MCRRCGRGSCQQAALQQLGDGCSSYKGWLGGVPAVSIQGLKCHINEPGLYPGGNREPWGGLEARRNMVKVGWAAPEPPTHIQCEDK